MVNVATATALGQSLAWDKWRYLREVMRGNADHVVGFALRA
jgi:hypothetical protein